jgi:hypothetical protein
LKKLFGILILAAILFNAGGYDLFFQYMIYRSDVKVFDKINNNHYRHSDLVEVKIPVNMPTQQDWDGYQAISGQVEVKGTRYDYAEIRITHNMLYLRVVPNTDLTKLVKAKVLYGKLVNDLPTSNTKHSNSPLTKKSLSESEYLTFTYSNSLAVTIKKLNDSFTSAGILKPTLEVGGQPPEA